MELVHNEHQQVLLVLSSSWLTPLLLSIFLCCLVSFRNDLFEFIYWYQHLWNYLGEPMITTYGSCL